MAGNAKPDIEGLGKEAQYKVISFVGAGGGTVDNFGLFDGTTPDEWDSSRVFYWQSKEHYLEIEIFSNKVNIWRSGTGSWSQRNDTLIIKKWNGEEYADVTTEYKQETSKIINGEWEKTIYELPKGKYKFFCKYEGNYRIDSEWYIEEIPNYKFLLKQNNQYCSIKSEYYSNGQFQPLALEGGTMPNENDYENFGFDGVNDLLISQNTKVVQGIDMGALGEGKYFEVELDNEIKKINKIVKEVEDLYSSPYSKGNRNHLIKATIKDGSMASGNINNMLNGTSAQDFYFVNGKTDTWILFEFNELVCVQEIKWIQDKNAGHGKWKLQGSNDNDSFVDLGELFDLNNGIFPIVNNEKYKYYKLQQIEGAISSSPWLYEVEFGIRPFFYNFLLKQNNHLYTFNGEKIDLSPSQILNQDNFKVNGFNNPSDITEEQWNNAFPDKTDLKLLMWTDDLEEAEIKAECKIETFRPYDKLNNEFEVCMLTDKETV